MFVHQPLFQQFAHCFRPKYRNYVLELNASDERGIQVVRNKISTFARASAGNTNLGCRIVILDEADSMTKVGNHASVNIKSGLSAYWC